MRTTTSYLPAGDGTPLHCRRWEPDGDARAVVCLVHGLGEHSGRWAQVAARLCEAGFAVQAADLRGHGKTPGTRGHAPFALLHADLDVLLDAARSRHPGRPVFVYGHSLGGLIALSHALRRRPDVAGLVITGAGLRSPVLDQRVKMGLARVLGRALPRRTLASGLDESDLCRDERVVAAYRADPLVHDRASLALGNDGARYARWCLEHAGELPVPALLLHGAGDRVTYPGGTEEFAARAAGDVTVKVYEGLAHELHNEPERKQVLDDVVAWLDRRVAERG